MTYWAEAKKSVLHSEICHLTSQAATARVANVFFLSEPLLETTNGPRFCNGSKLQHENVAYCWGFEVKAFSRFFHTKRNTLWHLTPPHAHTHTQTRTPPSLLQWSVMDVYKKGEIVCSDLCCCQIWWRGNKCLL